VSGDFMSILRDTVHEVIPSLICHTNMGPILSVYGAVSKVKDDLTTQNTITDVLPEWRSNTTFQSTRDGVPD
jgi:hypothetical protein